MFGGHQSDTTQYECGCIYCRNAHSAVQENLSGVIRGYITCCGHRQVCTCTACYVTFLQGAWPRCLAQLPLPSVYKSINSGSIPELPFWYSWSLCYLYTCLWASINVWTSDLILGECSVLWGPSLAQPVWLNWMPYTYVQLLGIRSSRVTSVSLHPNYLLGWP